MIIGSECVVVFGQASVSRPSFFSFGKVPLPRRQWHSNVDAVVAGNGTGARICVSWQQSEQLRKLTLILLMRGRSRGGPNKRHTNSNNNTFYSNREQ